MVSYAWRDEKISDTRSIDRSITCFVWVGPGKVAFRVA